MIRLCCFANVLVIVLLYAASFLDGVDDVIVAVKVMKIMTSCKF